MAQSASRSSSPRTATVATLSSQRTPPARGPGAGLRASTAAFGSPRVLPFRVALSVIVVALMPSSQQLAQPLRQVLRRVLRPRRLLDLRPSLGRPDLDPLHRPRPGDFLDQTDLLAETGRDEDPAELVHEALLRGSDERAGEQPDVPIEDRAGRDLLREPLPGRRSERDQAGIDQVRRDEELVCALRGEQLAKARGEAGAPLGIDRMLEDAGEHRPRSPRWLWRSTSCHFDPHSAESRNCGGLSSNRSLNRKAAGFLVVRPAPTRMGWGCAIPPSVF